MKLTLIRFALACGLLLFVLGCGSHSDRTSSGAINEFSDEPFFIESHSQIHSRGVNLDCNHYDSFALVMEAITSLGDFCQAQNMALARNGKSHCQENLCIEEAIKKGMDNKSLRMGVDFNPKKNTSIPSGASGTGNLPVIVQAKVYFEATVPLEPPSHQVKCANPVNSPVVIEFARSTFSSQPMVSKFKNSCTRGRP